MSFCSSILKSYFSVLIVYLALMVDFALPCAPSQNVDVNATVLEFWLKYVRRACHATVTQ